MFTSLVGYRIFSLTLDDEGETQVMIRGVPDDDIDNKEGSLDDNIIEVAPDDYNNNEVLSLNGDDSTPSRTTTRIITTPLYY